MKTPSLCKHTTALIIRMTNCTENEAYEVEDIMRHDIFHSTLDWQTMEQLEDAAIQGYAIFKEIQSLLN